jgi:hypothetical protein
MVLFKEAGRRMGSTKEAVFLQNHDSLLSMLYSIVLEPLWESETFQKQAGRGGEVDGLC